MGRNVVPRQKTGLNSIPRWEVGLAWNFNRGFVSSTTRCARTLERGRAEPWFNGQTSEGIVTVFGKNLGPGTQRAAGVVWKENARSIFERNRPEHLQGPRVCWGSSEATNTRWPILHRGHKRRVSLGELSCCGSGEAAG